MSWIRAGPEAPVSPNPPGTRVLVLWAATPASLPDGFAAITLTPARARALLGLMDAMPPPAPATMRTDHGITPCFRIESRQLVDDRVVFYAGSRAGVPGIAEAEARARAERDDAESDWEEDTCPACGASRRPAPTRAELELLMVAPLHFVDALTIVSPIIPYLLAVPETWTAAGLRAVDRGARWIEMDPTGVRWLQTLEEWSTGSERAGSPFAAGRAEGDAERVARLWRAERAAERQRRARESDEEAGEDAEEPSFGAAAFGAMDAGNGSDEEGDEDEQAGEVPELATLLVPRALLDIIAAG